jgi:acyl-CoA dehydrogenase
MDMSLSKEDAAFQDEVRSFLDENLTSDLQRAGELMTSVFTESKEACMAWHKILHARGWIAPNWPAEHGGTGWTAMQKYIFTAECSRARTPNVAPMGLQMCGPAIIGHGTPEQKAHYLPRILSGEDFWCQGYSEPGSGSDLASLQCKAVSDGDDYVINGTKIWTSQAHMANKIFCLVRTDNEGKPQHGITFLLMDMDDPGIKVEPIITMAGDHEVNQVFFDDVRVPKSSRLGDEDDGWTVAKYLLEFERGGANAVGMAMGLDRLAVFASHEPVGGTCLVDDPGFRRKLSELRIEVEAVVMTERRIMAALAGGQNPGPASSQLKLRGTEVGQKINELAVEAIGYYGEPDQKKARTWSASGGVNIEPVGRAEGLTTLPSYLNNRASTIYGGSSEVQRGIMAKFVLGL